MHRFVHLSLALSAILLAACGAQPPAAPAPAPPAAPAEPPAAEAPAEPAPKVDGAATPAEAPAAQEALAGTTWKADVYTFTFKEGGVVLVNGGPVTLMTGGKGMEASYTLQDGALTINAAEHTRTGTWDGTNLTMEGVPAQKM